MPAQRMAHSLSAKELRNTKRVHGAQEHDKRMGKACPAQFAQ